MQLSFFMQLSLLKSFPVDEWSCVLRNLRKDRGASRKSTGGAKTQTLEVPQPPPSQVEGRAVAKAPTGGGNMKFAGYSIYELT